MIVRLFGTKPDKARVPGAFEMMMKVDQAWPIAALRTFRSISSASMFRYVYTSGFLVERDQEKKLWVADKLRKIRVGMMLHYRNQAHQDTNACLGHHGTNIT